MKNLEVKEPVEVVESYFKYLKTGNFEVLTELLSDNITWHQPGMGSLSGVHQGKGKVIELFGEFMKRSAGSFQIDGVQSPMSNGSQVVANLHFSAARGDHKISMKGVDVMKVENGKIVEVALFSEDQAAEDAFWG